MGGAATGEGLAAATAGLAVACSSGAVEGHGNRIKVLKRRHYGCAGFILFRRARPRTRCAASRNRRNRPRTDRRGRTKPLPGSTSRRSPALPRGPGGRWRSRACSWTRRHRTACHRCSAAPQIAAGDFTESARRSSSAVRSILIQDRCITACVCAFIGAPAEAPGRTRK